MDVGLFVIDDQIKNQIASGDLVSDSGLETAVLISLFTDQRVTDEQLPNGITDKKGWWGDAFPAVSGDQIGSLLWVVARKKVTTQTLAEIENFAVQALNWMIEDGVAEKIEVTAETDELKRVGLTIIIYRPAGEASRYNLIWDEQELLRA